MAGIQRLRLFIAQQAFYDSRLAKVYRTRISVRLYFIIAIHNADTLWTVADTIRTDYRSQCNFYGSRFYGVSEVQAIQKAAFIGVIIVAAGVAAEAFALYRVHSLWLYDILMMVILFALGMIIAASNTLAMNEGRLRSGEASALIGLGGYIVGAVVSPLVGVGNILHSSAVVNVILVVLMILPAIIVRRLPADLGD